jgi:hypothetical protein
MEFKKRTLKLNVYGNSYEIDFPTVKKTQQYAEKLKEFGDDGAVDAVLDFLGDLGLPKNVTEEMEPEHLGQVIEALVPEKKK